jgi:aldehyde:ferredoxin oxidoreductase
VSTFQLESVHFSALNCPLFNFKSHERIVNLERLFIGREGITRRDDTLPRRFLQEPLPQGSGPSTGSVLELDPMLDEYYRARGWDVESGLPTKQKLAELGLVQMQTNDE